VLRRLVVAAFDGGNPSEIVELDGRVMLPVAQAAKSPRRLPDMHPRSRDINGPSFPSRFALFWK
jgi:hypothetical protein